MQISPSQPSLMMRSSVCCRRLRASCGLCSSIDSTPSLTRSFPERAEKLFSEAEVKSVERYEHLLRLKDLYAPKAD